MNNDDRRVRKTKKALIDALIFLLSQKELRSITVKELTDTADVHRATFYAHYKDVYDLYEQLETHAIEELKQMISSASIHSSESVFKLFVDYVFENTALCRMFFSCTSDSNFQKRVSTALEECYLTLWLYSDKVTAVTDEMRYLTAYNIQGILAIISKWMEEGFSCSKEQVISMLKLVNDNFDKIA